MKKYVPSSATPKPPEFIRDHKFLFHVEVDAVEMADTVLPFVLMESGLSLPASQLFLTVLLSCKSRKDAEKLIDSINFPTLAQIGLLYFWEIGQMELQLKK